MIDRQRVMDETRQGLDILLDLYPQAKDCVGTKKQFKMRLDEKTASATIRQNRAGLWVVHDFGGDDEDLNAIDAWMRLRGWDRSRFGPAVQAIAQEYGIRDELSRDVNFARVVERAATDDEKEGQWYYEIREFTDRELKILGPGVTREVCGRLHWYALEWLGKVKDRRIKEFHSNEAFPIFMRECFIEGGRPAGEAAGTTAGGRPAGEAAGTTAAAGTAAGEAAGTAAAADRFYKVYRPFEPEKRWRFMYFPEGAKPQNYINGLHELKKEHERLNAKARQEAGEEEVGGTRPLSELKKTVQRGVQRYYRVVLCSGERDALCVAARGDCPVWLNSETARLDRQDYQQIIRYGGELTNIPDLDATGIARGAAQALKFMEMKTVWLPESLKDLRDNRGRPSKDFRDWCQYFPTMDDYYDLMDGAVEAKFWKTRVTKDGERRHKIDALCLHQFLRLQGFAVLRDDIDPDPQLIRVKHNIVYQKRPRDVRDFVRLWSLGAKDPDVPTETLRQDVMLYIEHAVRNLILTDVSFTPAYLAALPTYAPDFTHHTARTQDFCFRNGLVHCHGEGYELHLYKDQALTTCVRSQEVIPHDFRKLEPMFRVEWVKGETMDDGVTPRFRLEVTDARSSHLMGYLINTSRLHWRQEVEGQFPDSVDAQRAYMELHPFEIAGSGLTPQQLDDQAQSLLNKLFTIGYLLHAYKSPSRTWAAFLMDNRVSETGEANGRSGKSFFSEALKQLLHIEVAGIDGRNTDIKKDTHATSKITRATRLVHVEDLGQFSDVSDYYNLITGDMSVNPKGLTPFTIPFAESPKFLFSTNYVPASFDASSDARMLYVTFSDWYHHRTQENPFHYQEERTIYDDFQKNLFDADYRDEEWNADLNLLMQCEQFYLSICTRSVKIQPPMANIIQRKLKAEMGAAFERWASLYFSADGPNVNKQLVRKTVYETYMRDNPGERDKINRFTIRLKAFAQWAPWIHCLNPADLLDTQGRNKQTYRDPQTGEVVQQEMIHLRTKAEEARRQENDRRWNDAHPGALPPSSDKWVDGQIF